MTSTISQEKDLILNILNKEQRKYKIRDLVSLVFSDFSPQEVTCIEWMIGTRPGYNIIFSPFLSLCSGDNEGDPSCDWWSEEPDPVDCVLGFLSPFLKKKRCIIL
jgi:hypothetical protein